MGRVNDGLDRLILRAADLLGTRWSAVALCLLPFVSLPAAVASRSAVVIVLWLSSTFLQLVFLPVLLIAGNAAAEATAQLILETHQASLDEFALAKEARESHAQELAALKMIAASLHVAVTGEVHPAAITPPEVKP